MTEEYEDEDDRDRNTHFIYYFILISITFLSSMYAYKVISITLSCFECRLFFSLHIAFLCIISFLLLIFSYLTSFPFSQILIALADAFSITPYETHSTFSANQQEYQLKLSSRYRSNTTQLNNLAVVSARTLGKRNR